MPVRTARELLNGNSEQVVNGIHLSVNRKCALSEPRSVKQVTHKSIESVGGVFYQQRALVTRLQQLVGEPFDGGERRPKVVRHRREQRVFEAVGFPERVGAFG